MATIYSWPSYEVDLFVFGYLYCPVPDSLLNRVAWLRDYLHTMTGAAKHTVADIVTQIKEYQHLGCLPAPWMKLPGEYSLHQLRSIWHDMYADLGPRDPSVEVGKMYCRLDILDGPELYWERLHWLLNHLRASGGFMLWSEEMCTAILKLYEAREDRNKEESEGNENEMTVITNAVPFQERRKYSNRYISNDQAVSEACLNIYPPVDLSEEQLQYFFFNQIIKGDTSTRKKRLQYYYSDVCLQSQATPLRNLPLGNVGNSYATAIDLTDFHSYLDAPPCSGTPQKQLLPEQSRNAELSFGPTTDQQTPQLLSTSMPMSQGASHDPFKQGSFRDNNLMPPPASPSIHLTYTLQGQQPSVPGTDTRASGHVSTPNSPAKSSVVRQENRPTLLRRLAPNNLQRPLHASSSRPVNVRNHIGQGIRKSLSMSGPRATSGNIRSTVQEAQMPIMTQNRPQIGLPRDSSRQDPPAPMVGSIPSGFPESTIPTATPSLGHNSIGNNMLPYTEARASTVGHAIIEYDYAALWAAAESDDVLGMLPTQ